MKSKSISTSWMHAVTWPAHAKRCRVVGRCQALPSAMGSSSGRLLMFLSRCGLGNLKSRRQLSGGCEAFTLRCSERRAAHRKAPCQEQGPTRAREMWTASIAGRGPAASQERRRGAQRNPLLVQVPVWCATGSGLETMMSGLRELSHGVVQPLQDSEADVGQAGECEVQVQGCVLRW